MSIIEIDRSILTNNQLVQSIESHPGVQLAFKHGGFVAGGCLRFALANPAVEYNKKSSSKDYNRVHTYAQRADIDIFFSKYDDYTAFTKAAKTSKYFEPEPSMSHFADNYEVKRAFNRQATCIPIQKVQTIKFRMLSPEKTLEDFDFANSAIALTADKAFIHSDWQELEAQKLISIQSNRSNMLGHRLKKYIMRHGYVGVTKESEKHIIDWAMRQRKLGKEWYDSKSIWRPGGKSPVKTTPDGAKGNYGMKRQFAFLLGQKSPIATDDLLYLTGMFKSSCATKYVDSHNALNMYVDWASAFIEDAALALLLQRKGAMDVKAVQVRH